MDIFSTNVAYASVDSFVRSFNAVVLNPLIGFMFAVAIIVFLFGLFEFLSHTDSQEARKKGKLHMLYGIIGIFIMMSVFTIMRIILNTIGVSEGEVDVRGGGVHLQDYTPPPGNSFKVQ